MPNCNPEKSHLCPGPKGGACVSNTKACKAPKVPRVPGAPKNCNPLKSHFCPGPKGGACVSLNRGCKVPKVPGAPRAAAAPRVAAAPRGPARTLAEVKASTKKAIEAYWKGIYNEDDVISAMTEPTRTGYRVTNDAIPDAVYSRGAYVEGTRAAW